MSNHSVTDEIILEGFRSLHQAMAEGFDAMNRRIDERFAEFEQRMVRQFDKRDERLDDHERRITTLEATS